MIATFISLIVPSLAVTEIATVGLLVLLVGAQLVDYEESRLKNIARYIGVFSTPLVVLFAFTVLLRIVIIVNS